MAEITSGPIKGSIDGTVVTVEAGQNILLDATTEDRVVFSRDGIDLVVVWPADGRKVVLDGFFSTEVSNLPPQLLFVDGSIISPTYFTSLAEEFGTGPLVSAGGGAAYEPPPEEAITSTEVSVFSQSEVNAVNRISETLPNTVQNSFVRDGGKKELVILDTTPTLRDDTFSTNEDADLSVTSITKNTPSDTLPDGGDTVYDTPGSVTVTLPSGVLTGVFSSWIVDGGNSALWIATLTGFGQLTFDATDPVDVHVSFDIDPVGSTADGASGFDLLGVGEQATVAFSYGTLANSTADPAQGEVTINVTGTNDAPVVSSTLTSSAIEGASAVQLNLLSLASDADLNDTLDLSDMSSLPSGFTLSGTTLNIDPTDASFDSLAVGETTQVVVTYNVVDSQGVSVAQSATITITGTNDAPTVSNTLTAGAIEGGSVVVLDLLSLANDVDISDTLSLSNMSTLPSGLTVSGTTLSIDPTDATFNSLSTGDTTQVVVTYDIEDSQGGSVSQSATITITGTNDAPTVSSVLTAGAVQGSSLLYLDLLSLASDVDLNATLSLTNMSALPAGLTLSGTVLTIDPSDASFSGLGAGATTQIVVSYDVTDGQGGVVAQTATITITGNSAPSAVADSLYTNANTFTVDDFVVTDNDTDPDSADVLFVSSASPATGGYTVTDGTDVINVSGVAGDGTFTYQTDDGNGGQNTGTVTVTYVGSNSIFADSVDNIVIGGAGDDTLVGITGDDTLYGGGGADELRGGNGDDLIFGGDGSDIINGGSNNDTVSYSDKSAAVFVDLDAGTAIVSGSETDTLSNIENIIGSDYDDTLDGGGADEVNRLEGGLGDDILTGNGDADTFVYTSISDGDDTITDFEISDNDSVDLDELFDELGIAGVSRAEDIILTDTGTDTILTLDGQAGFSITFSNVDLSVIDEALFLTKIVVGDES